MDGTQMQLEDWLDDLCVRFIINLPEEDLSSVARICFQVEEAQWFYEDFIRPLDPNLPSMSLRTFCLRIFQHCPLLASFSAENHIQAFEEFLQYKTRVPVRGAILLNHEMDSTVLVKGWKKGANWSFPRGKINKDEDDLDCAIREVWEETGLDLRAAGVVPEGKPKYIEITMREQQMRLYVFRDVPMDTNFQPRTRKEISKIQWYKLSQLPAFRKKGSQNANEDGITNANKFYMVAPFLVPLKKWVVSQKKLEVKRVIPSSSHLPNPHFSLDEAPTEDDTWSRANPGQPPTIDSLEGATHELQRLLKLQPPTQGLQSQPPQEDKASALLSMLKAKDSQPQPQLQVNNQLPHTPLGLTTAQPPQPRNPHHHTNQHQTHIQATGPPPHFSIHQHQPSTQWNANQNESYQMQLQMGQHAPLIHPQPLPPQVQRAMFNQSTFQENLQSSENLQNQRPPEYSYSTVSTLPTSIPSSRQQPAFLDGQSAALLNAFQKNSTRPTSTQLAPQQVHTRRSDPPTDFPSITVQSGAQDNQPVSELAGSSSQVVPASQGKMYSGSDSHRSALLGMFRSGPPEATTKDSSKPSHQSLAASPRAQEVGGVMEKRLADAFRRAPLASDAPVNLNPQPSYSATETSAALSNFLALKPRSDQATASRTSPDHGSLPRTGPVSGVNQAQPQAQPIRILQRGSKLDGQNYASPLERSPYSNQAIPSLAGLPSSADASSLPSPGTSARRPEPSQDQKRQLLSLFGKKQPPQPQQQASFTPLGQQSIELAAGDLSRSRLASVASGSGEGTLGPGPPSRGGTETPISPADQSFLLDYLQSVTSNASR